MGQPKQGAYLQVDGLVRAKLWHHAERRCCSPFCTMQAVQQHTLATDQGLVSCQVLGMSTLRGTPAGATRSAYDSADHTTTCARLALKPLYTMQCTADVRLCNTGDAHHERRAVICD